VPDADFPARTMPALVRSCRRRHAVESGGALMVRVSTSMTLTLPTDPARIAVSTALGVPSFATSNLPPSW
jgi:hypothetical protein